MAENSKKSKSESTNNEPEKIKRCLVIMPFSDPEGYEQGHFRKVYEQIIKPAAAIAGYEAYRVDDDSASDSITAKIFKELIDCDMAICDLSSRNPNVLYELGIRHAFDKTIVLINDDKTDRIFDIQGILTIPYRSARKYDEVEEDRAKIAKAITDNEKSSSVYSIMNIIELQKATYDADPNDIHSSEFNSALIMRLIDALEKSERNQANVSKWQRYEESNNLTKAIDRIELHVDVISDMVNDALEYNITMDVNKLKEQLRALTNQIDYCMSRNDRTTKQTLRLDRQLDRLDEIWDNLKYLKDDRSD